LHIFDAEQFITAQGFLGNDLFLALSARLEDHLNLIVFHLASVMYLLAVLWPLLSAQQ